MNETQAQLQAGYADFDFLIGRWKIRHRRLREILKGSTSWDEFEGYAVDRKILGGLGSISEVTLQLASGPLQGMTTRLFDPKTGQWRIYWTAGPDGAFTTPMIGGFAQGHGAICSEPLRLDGHHTHLMPLGTGVLGGRRNNLGDELDHGSHQAAGINARPRGASVLKAAASRPIPRRLPG
jgi:hypothetical protein